MTKLYDRAKDTEPFSFQLGLPVHLGRLSAVVEMLLAHPDSEIIRALARIELDRFRAWADENGIPTGLESLAEKDDEPATEPLYVGALLDMRAAYDRRYPFGVEPQLQMQDRPEAS